MQTVYDYEGLIESYLAGKIENTDFIKIYFDNLKAEWDSLDDKTYKLLEHLFSEANNYTDNPDLLRLKPDQFIDEKRLCESAEKTLHALQALKEKNQEISEDNDTPLPFHQTITMVEYECLLGKFIRQEIDAEQFAGGFRYACCMLNKFPISDELHAALKPLYDAEDNLVTNPSLCLPTEDDVNEDQLRDVAEETYFKIRRLYFAGKLYERKSVVLKHLLIKVSKAIFGLSLCLFFFYHSMTSFSETVGLLYYSGDIFGALNSFILFFAFLGLSGLFTKSIHPKSFEIVEIKLLFFALLLPKPTIEAFGDA